MKITVTIKGAVECVLQGEAPRWSDSINMIVVRGIPPADYDPGWMLPLEDHEFLLRMAAERAGAIYDATWEGRFEGGHER
jgi:hypothetical protein